MKALTPAWCHHNRQVSSLTSSILPNVPPSTTGTTRMSLSPPASAHPMIFRLHHPAGSSPLFPAESSSFPTDHWFASGCSPPRFTATQFPSATGLWLSLTRTCTVLYRRPHERTTGGFQTRPYILLAQHSLLLCKNPSK